MALFQKLVLLLALLSCFFLTVLSKKQSKKVEAKKPEPKKQESKKKSKKEE